MIQFLVTKFPITLSFRIHICTIIKFNVISSSSRQRTHIDIKVLGNKCYDSKVHRYSKQFYIQDEGEL
jgi:hypothetical protein